MAKRIWDDASLGRVHEVADKAQRVQAMFDGIVQRYERVNTVTTLGLDATWRRRLVKGLALPAGAAVLDIACGTGQVLRRIARAQPEAAQLVGVDFSEVMIRRARWAGPGRAHFCRADALRLPFPAESFDAVTCAFGVRNFADPAAGLAEMFRVLRPGGVVGILEFSMPEASVLGSLYRFYLRRVLPRLASWLSRDASGAYEYLQRSVETFTAVDLAEMMRRCGFEAAMAERLTLGVVHLYSAQTGRRKSDMSPVARALRKTVRISRWAMGVDGSDRWVDVWNRAGHRYRRRAAILLAVDMVLFLGLCLFTYWLRTGRYLPFHGEEYYSLLMRSFQVSGSDQVSLTDMLLWPINVERTPLQLVVVALVMAALISVPVLVSILYRFPFALPFAAMVAFVAVMPWLGITGIGACALASLRPFRMGFRFGSALVGLVPFAVYLWLSTRTPGGPPVVSPLEQFKLYSPWGLSLMVACFHMAVVLSVASIVGYRPGAIAPVLAVLFAVPVGLFESRIGQDELYYSILEARHGPAASGGFQAEDLARFIAQQPAAEVLYQKVFSGQREGLEELLRQWRLDLAAIAPLKQKVENLALAETEQDRFETVGQAERFISDFPDSRRVAAALYLQGRALDTQLDLARLRGEGSLGYYDDFPSPVSNGVWRSLAAMPAQPA